MRLVPDLKDRRGKAARGVEGVFSRKQFLNPLSGMSHSILANDKYFYYSTIAPFYHIRAKERAKYDTLLHCRTRQKYGLKRSDKMVAQNEPNFALFTSSDLDFLTDELFTEKELLK